MCFARCWEDATMPRSKGEKRLRSQMPFVLPMHEQAIITPVGHDGPKTVSSNLLNRIIVKVPRGGAFLTTITFENKVISPIKL